MAASSISRNTLITVTGMMLPVLVAVAVIPPILSKFGFERSGLLMLIWSAFGYFAVMDFGFGRALTYGISIRLATSQRFEIPSAFLWSLGLSAIVSLALSAAAFPLIPALIDKFSAISVEHRAEAIASFQALVVGLVVVATSSVLNGYLMAFERFDLVNVVKIPLFGGTLLAPLAVHHLEQPVFAAAMLMVGLRVLAWMGLLYLCYIVTPSQLVRMHTRVADVRSLIMYGGWISAINIVNSLMAHADRWALAIWSSLAAVTYYTVPLELGTKLLLIPGAIATVLFPVFSRTALSPVGGSGHLLYYATAYTALLTFAVAVIGIVFAEEILRAWLGSDFAQGSSNILLLVLLGSFLNAIAHPAVSLLLGSGRASLVASCVTIEFIAFVVALWAAVPTYGAIGAAAIWVIRVALDAAFIVYFVVRERPYKSSMPALLIITLFAALICGTGPSSIGAKVVYCVVCLVLVVIALALVERKRRATVRKTVSLT